MLERLSPVRRNLALTLLGVLLVAFAWKVRSALNPLILGLLLAYMLHPMVLSLERRGWSRQLAVNVIFCATALTLGLMAFALYSQGRSLWRDISSEGALSEIDVKVDALLGKAHASLAEWGLIEQRSAVAPGDGS